MKQTFLLLALLNSGIALATTLHDTDFSNVYTSSGQLTTYTGNSEIAAGIKVWGDGSTKTIQGLYLNDGSGIKLNTGSAAAQNTTITYLYIGSNITFTTGTPYTEGIISWNHAGSGFVMSSADGAWLDINTDFTSFTSRINLTSMTTGSVYLNQYGALTSSLASTNTVYATALFADTYEGSYTLDSANNTITRTLLTGDFSSWGTDQTVLKQKVKLAGVTDYVVSASADGLKVSYLTSAKAIPEPATATLSLLALAGLASRRRRK